MRAAQGQPKLLTSSHRAGIRPFFRHTKVTSLNPMKSANSLGLRAWTADEVRQDASLIQRLSAVEVEGFDQALQHASRVNKPLLAMDQADFPLSDASRTPFEDFDQADEKRHLLRLWLSIPASQPLPPAFKEYFGDVRAGAVRGGVRGSARPR